MGKNERKINVLDKGYVRHLETFGSDLTVVNNARASYDKESAELTDSDKRLIAFLAREKHMSPFRSPRISFEVYAPLVVARQWWRYAIDSQHIEDGTPWSESSRRYITEKTEFYLPGAGEWRSKPANSKQGSGAPLDEAEGIKWTQALEQVYKDGEVAYEAAMDAGIAPEQARLFLPAYGLMVRWRYTASLQAICHFLDQRLKNDAQKEIYDYAIAVLQIVREDFPISAQHLIEAKGTD
ncbi:FAD-dependent thymidylate synthase [Lysinibacillus xylanilyticus]|uniref:FAD-dependent thymidylate synthase n=1 Tax=Lysinibacillus xylanilyticus TaxID=582475 RepID=A0ABT4EMB6_9BACI|nr:FAD-dependent thymidylate synthase [Lysinibacillus xylanilyticus]MCY9546804.1 FAD-dependent thymidylate synthase [Lysinibacillus xylanilyticus]